MTVATTSNRDEFVGDGLLTLFDFTFVAYSVSQIKVEIDGQEVTTGFTISRNSNNIGGTVTFDTAPASGIPVVIYREIPLTQILDLVRYGRFPAESIERALDEGVMIDQQLHQRDLELAEEIESRAADILSKVLNIADGNNTMQQNIDMDNHRILDVADPSDEQDAVNLRTARTLIAVIKGANFVQEDVPTVGLEQGVRWYKPSDNEEYIYYIDTNGNGLWTETTDVGDNPSSLTVDLEDGRSLEEFATETEEDITQLEEASAAAKSFAQPLPYAYGMANTSNGTIRSIICGIDSLTAGAGGNSYFEFFASAVRKTFGDGGGGFISFDDTASADGVSFGKQGFSYIKNLDKSSLPAQCSFDYGGLHEENFVAGNGVDWDVQRQWDNMRIYYLQQPNGGQFIAGHTNINFAQWTISVDTNGPLALAWVDMPVVVGGSSGIRIGHSGDGVMTLFGALSTIDNDSPTIIRQAFGGYSMADYAGLDPIYQQAWFAELAPDLYILNGGMNDRGASLPAEFISNVDAFLSNLPATCDKLLLAPAEPSDELTSYMHEYRGELLEYAKANQCGFLDISKQGGDYATAVSLGLMLDTVHPNELYNKSIAKFVADALGFTTGEYVLPTVFNTSGGAPLDEINRIVDLPVVHINTVDIGTPQVVYDLGLTNAFPSAVIELDVVAQRDGTGEIMQSKHYMRIANQTTINAATGVSATSTQTEVFRDTGGTTTQQHTITGSVASGRAEISISAIGYDQIVTVTGRVMFGNMDNLGQSVFVN